MGVYIPGMEMPTDEPLLVKINPDGSVSTTARNGYKKYTAVHVPKHGRLGDLDELLKEVNRIYDQYDAGIISEIACMNAFAWAIRNAPTIISVSTADKEGEG